MSLSSAAKSALINAGTSRQAAPVHTVSGSEVERELIAAGYITAQRGLTRAGSIARDRLVNEALSKF